MSGTLSDPFDLTATQIQQVLLAQGEAFPELETVRSNPQALRNALQIQWALAETQACMENIQQIPQTSYTFYRFFRRNGDRKNYETPYFQKRSNLAAAALRLFLGQSELKDVVQDYIWNICEETTWVLPAHERDLVDLFSAETGFVLAETLLLLGETLDAEVRHRVRAEVERRILDPYLRFHRLMWWHMGHNNWNGVCNSSVAATFLLLEPEAERVAQALEIALIGLRAFLNTAFEDDGSSTEGVSYWHYGLFNFVALAEMLYARSNGAINLLASEQLRRIATYPATLQLSGSLFASFSDSDETSTFHPGIITRLVERTQEQSLLNLIARPARLNMDWRLTMMLRDILWWDGSQREAVQPDDAVLSSSGVARIVSRTRDDTPVIVAIKAGHNAENHNQNDVGSFMLHVTGENLLTDPGRGLYTRDYFGPHRYENVFANSYGHSVPRIDGQLQRAGRDFAGQLVSSTIGPEQSYKQIEIEFAHAYAVADLTSARRRVRLAATGDDAGTLWLHDHFMFSTDAHTVEEAFITWFDCDLDGAMAVIHGQQHDLQLTIEAPQGVSFALEGLEEQSKANAKKGILKRLSITFPAAKEITV
ncbi:MAG TPA: heparinase II/III family protein, partial [Ktedonobacteraceae bacterium]|nr:heparinase II/III family protein [Ktedonobacteraceae bacterium]